MMLSATPQERLALGVTALLLAGGVGVRTFAPQAPPAEWQVSSPADDTSRGGTLAAVRARSELAAARERAAAAPLARGERIDPNRADVLELQRLPRVGPALARRIVAYREQNGPFRSLADLDAVTGVGPALVASIAPHVALPAGSRGRAAAGARLDVNRAGAAELATLPGIGPALAERIVEWRGSHGPFRSVEAIDEVPGIGPRLVERLRPLLRTGP